MGVMGIQSYGQMTFSGNEHLPASDHPLVSKIDSFSTMGNRNHLQSIYSGPLLTFDHSFIHYHDSVTHSGSYAGKYFNFNLYSFDNMPVNKEVAYKIFKFNMLALPVKNEIPDLNLPKIKRGDPSLLNDRYTGNLLFALGSPVSFWYNKFNKEERSKRKLAQIILEEDSLQQADNKFNREKVAEWTHLNEEELTEFIVFCELTPKYILTNTEYDIMNLVKDKLLEFKRTHQLNQIE
jgi:hypothetical protein